MDRARVVEITGWRDEAELRQRFEDALANDERIFLFSLRRNPENGDVESNALSGCRHNCRTTWLELIGALWLELQKYAFRTCRRDEG